MKSGNQRSKFIFFDILKLINKKHDGCILFFCRLAQLHKEFTKIVFQVTSICGSWLFTDINAEFNIFDILPSLHPQNCQELLKPVLQAHR